MLYHCKKYFDNKSMVTAVSGFIEQIGSMIKEFQNKSTNHQLFTIPSSFKELAQTLVSKPTCISS